MYVPSLFPVYAWGETNDECDCIGSLGYSYKRELLLPIWEVLGGFVVAANIPKGATITKYTSTKVTDIWIPVDIFRVKYFDWKAMNALIHQLNQGGEGFRSFRITLYGPASTAPQAGQVSQWIFEQFDCFSETVGLIVTFEARNS